MANTINELTPEQKAQVPVWRERYDTYGECTKPADEKTTEKAMSELYRIGGIEQPTKGFLWLPSPCACIKKIVEMTEDKNVSVGAYSYGSIEAYWISFYMFAHKVMSVKYEKKLTDILYLWDELCKSGFCVYPFDEICICSDRPATFHLDNDLLHNDSGPAMSFRDDWSIYAIEGVRAPKWVIETPAEDLDPRRIMDPQLNVELRRRMVRKIGEERMLEGLGGKLITQGSWNPETGLTDPEPKGSDSMYFLYEVDWKTSGDPSQRRVLLKMWNRSESVWHYEYVPEDIRTCQEANNWRRHNDKTKLWAPMQLT